MITSTTIRISNWVRLWVANIDDTDKLTLINWQVKPNDILSIYQHEQAGKKHSYEPILLTPELLVKNGFQLIGGTTKKSNKIKYHSPDVDIYFLKEDNSIWIIDFYWENVKIYNRHLPNENQIKYLHQLMNLYQSLTGSELNIQL